MDLTNLPSTLTILTLIFNKLNGAVDLSCAKKVLVGNPQLGTCAAGQQRDAGLCYAGCKPAYGGVGPVCWGQCPATHPVSCGGGCAKTQDACALNTTDQVLSVLEVVANVGLAVATAGTSTAATAGAKAGATAGKVAMKNGAKFAGRITKQEAIAIIKKQAKEAGKELAQATVETYADAVVQAGTTGEFDPEVLAGLDPTGVASVVVAYAKPVCTPPTEAALPPATRVGNKLQVAALVAAPATSGASTGPSTAAPSVAAPTVPSNSVTLKGANGKFVVAEPNGSAAANREVVGAWERFVLETHADGTVSFKGAHGKYLAAEADGRVSASAAAVGPSAKFTRTNQPGGNVLLKSVHGKYLTAQTDGRLTASRAQPGAPELFVLR